MDSVWENKKRVKEINLKTRIKNDKKKNLYLPPGCANNYWQKWSVWKENYQDHQRQTQQTKTSVSYNWWILWIYGVGKREGNLVYKVRFDKTKYILPNQLRGYKGVHN